MNSGITRWKIVPSYMGSVFFLPSRGSFHSLLPVARPTKLSTVFGAWSGSNRTLMLPLFVTNVAYCGMGSSSKDVSVLGLTVPRLDLRELVRERAARRDVLDLVADDLAAQCLSQR